MLKYTYLSTFYIVVRIIEHSKLNGWVHRYLVFTPIAVTDVYHLKGRVGVCGKVVFMKKVKEIYVDHVQMINTEATQVSGS